MNRTFVPTIAICCVGSNCRADSWGPVSKTEFFSKNEKRVLKIDVHPDWPNKPGHCHGTLYQINGTERTVVWSRHLINNHAPVRVFVSDSGHYVLTMDEWHRVGELPLVIYGHDGELVRVHSTESLGLKDDGEQISQTISSYWWNERSMSFFGPKENTFFIRLHWGKQLLIRLDDGALMDDEWYAISKGWLMPEGKWKTLHRFADSRISELAIGWLESSDPEERQTAATICGERKLAKAVPLLKKLLDDDHSWDETEGKRETTVYPVRQAAKEALERLSEKTDH